MDGLEMSVLERIKGRRDTDGGAEVDVLPLPSVVCIPQHTLDLIAAVDEALLVQLYREFVTELAAGYGTQEEVFRRKLRSYQSRLDRYNGCLTATTST
jgi:hypothetical protein